MADQNFKNFSEDSAYATPFNVDLFLSYQENFFEEYRKKVLSLPVSVRDIMMDISTAEFIEERLGPTFNLNLEQKTWITRIIRDVLFGDIFIGDMTTIISKKLNTDSQVAQQITIKILNELFASAIEDIKKIQRDRFASRIGPVSPASQTPRNSVPPTQVVNENNIIDLRNQNQS